MSGVKHTPGPWFEQAGFSDDVEITAASRKGMVAICAMDLGFTGHIGVEQEANASLIALSPEMFEYILSSAQNGCATAQQIIARARGEQDGGGE